MAWIINLAEYTVVIFSIGLAGSFKGFNLKGSYKYAPGLALMHELLFKSFQITSDSKNIFLFLHIKPFHKWLKTCMQQRAGLGLDLMKNLSTYSAGVTVLVVSTCSLEKWNAEGSMYHTTCTA